MLNKELVTLRLLISMGTNKTVKIIFIWTPTFFTLHRSRKKGKECGWICITDNLNLNDVFLKANNSLGRRILWGLDIPFLLFRRIMFGLSSICLPLLNFFVSILLISCRSFIFCPIWSRGDKRLQVRLRSFIYYMVVVHLRIYTYYSYMTESQQDSWLVEVLTWHTNYKRIIWQNATRCKKISTEFKNPHNFWPPWLIKRCRRKIRVNLFFDEIKGAGKRIDIETN